MSVPSIPLDMTIHSLDEVEGKTITINGATYCLLQLLAEGGEGTVYPLMNIKTRLILFVVKLHKFKPPSPEYTRLLSLIQTEERHHLNFAMESAHLKAVSEDLYQIPGGIIGFQRFIGSIDYLENYELLMEQANELAISKKFKESISVCDHVLDKNKMHTSAMTIKAFCLAELGLIGDAISIWSLAIELEPNDLRIYYNASKTIARHGMFRRAIRFLDKALECRKWDFESWHILSEIAIDYDLIYLASQRIEEVLRVVANCKEFRRLARELRRSGRRFTRYQALVAQAVTKQVRHDWEHALCLWERAVRVSNNNSLAQLNYSICKYYLGRGADVAQSVGSLLYILPPTSRMWPSCALLTALCLQCAGDTAFARNVLSMIDIPVDLVDLPGVPIVITEEGILEDRNIDAIFSLIEFLENDARNDDKDMLRRLEMAYIEYNKLLT